MLAAVQDLILPHIRAADANAVFKAGGTVDGQTKPTPLVEEHGPESLEPLLDLATPAHGGGREALLSAAQTILRHSVNTWDPGFLDKLYSSTDAVGLAADLLLSALNTNVHVYTVAPALTLVEKHTATALAHQFGLRGPHAGGVTVPGGAASNYTAMLVARNFMFPEVKAQGAAALAQPLAVFTSDVAHYSVSTAAQQLGLGTGAVHAVRTAASDAMDVGALREAVAAARAAGKRPFFVCATAGTTVRGAYDPLGQIADVCSDEAMWMHVDGCWGGAAAFSEQHRHKLSGSGRADSVSFNPHKMLGVPLTTTFVLGADMRTFHNANSLEAGYLFHGGGGGGGASSGTAAAGSSGARGGAAEAVLAQEPAWRDVHDLAQFVPQCGRRGDALKFYLAWHFHGTAGFAAGVDAAFAAAQSLWTGLSRAQGVQMVGDDSPQCTQVCFRYVGDAPTTDPDANSAVTRRVVAALVTKGWMVDYTSSPEGEYLRVVCNRGTSEGIVQGLIKAVVSAGEEALAAK